MTTLYINIHINIIHDSKKYKHPKCLRMSEEMERAAWMQQNTFSAPSFHASFKDWSSTLLWLAWNLKGM